MTVATLIRKNRIVQLIIAVVILWLGYYKFFSSSLDSYTPEELNSILQNKDEDTVSIRKVELTNQGLSKPYIDPKTLKSVNWDITGNTIINNNEYLRLTSDNQHQVGNIFNKFPIQAESFEMELTFHIHAKSSRGLVGDGFAIWFLNEKSEIGDVFGARNFFKGLGIMIDTYKNGRRGHFPFVNVMLGDGNAEYNKHTDGFENRLAGCNARNVLNPSNGYSKARIVYIKNGYLSLDFNFNGLDEKWTNCVTLTDIHLPPVKYLGFTAETGDLSENVDIIENKVFALYNPNSDETESSFIESIEQLETLIKEQTEDVIEDVKEEKKGGGRHRTFKKLSKGQSRKSLRRLKNSERRIKERERQLRMAKYGDPESNFVKRSIRKIIYFTKVALVVAVIVLLGWIGFIIYRVQRQKIRSKPTGLLD